MTSLFDLPFEDDGDEQVLPAAPPEARPARAAPPAPDAAEARRVYSVRELTAALRSRIEDAFPRIWVEGELAECRSWQSGHVYFTLKDGEAQLQGVMFRTDAIRLRFTPAAGLHVLVRGRLSVYPAKGHYQLVADAMEPRGAGALQVAFEQLKRRLQAEGLFEAARKRPLPMLPRRVGVVTSIDGAALRDILRVLRTRRAPVDIVISPARVQGDGAAADLTRALRRVCLVEGVDVVIVGRGGGASEDLRAFNDERLARTIAACHVPVVSAIGHEIDTTMADFVADVRAATPSQAAELVVRQAAEFSDRLTAMTRQLVLGTRSRLERMKVGVLRLERRPAFAHFRDGVVSRDRTRHDAAVALASALRRATTTRRQTLQALDARLAAQHPRQRLTSQWRHLAAAETALSRAVVRSRTARLAGLEATDSRLAAAGPAARLRQWHRAVDRRRHQLVTLAVEHHHRRNTQARELAGRLDALSPLRTLARGYAVCWDSTHTRPLRSAAEVHVGGAVHVQLAQGDLHCRVDAVRLPPSEPV